MRPGAGRLRALPPNAVRSPPTPTPATSPSSVTSGGFRDVSLPESAGARGRPGVALVARLRQRPLRARPLVAAHHCSVPSPGAGAGSTFLGVTRWCLGELGRWRGRLCLLCPHRHPGRSSGCVPPRTTAAGGVGFRAASHLECCFPSRWVPLARSQCVLAAVSFVYGGKCTEHSIYHLTICKCATLRRRTHSPHCLTIASVRTQTFASSPSTGPCTHGAVPPPPLTALLSV